MEDLEPASRMSKMVSQIDARTLTYFAFFPRIFREEEIARSLDYLSSFVAWLLLIFCARLLCDELLAPRHMGTLNHFSGLKIKKD